MCAHHIILSPRFLSSRRVLVLGACAAIRPAWERGGVWGLWGAASPPPTNPTFPYLAGMLLPERDLLYKPFWGMHFSSIASYTNRVGVCQIRKTGLSPPSLPPSPLRADRTSAPTAPGGGKGKDKPCPYGGFGAGGLRPPAPKPQIFLPLLPRKRGRRGPGEWGVNVCRPTISACCPNHWSGRTITKR